MRASGGSIASVSSRCCAWSGAPRTAPNRAQHAAQGCARRFTPAPARPRRASVAGDKPRPPEPRGHPQPAPALPDLRAVDRHAQQTPSPDAHLSSGRMARPEPATVPSPSCPYAPREARRSSRGSNRSQILPQSEQSLSVSAHTPLAAQVRLAMHASIVPVLPLSMCAITADMRGSPGRLAGRPWASRSKITRHNADVRSKLLPTTSARCSSAAERQLARRQSSKARSPVAVVGPLSICRRLARRIRHRGRPRPFLMVTGLPAPFVVACV